MEMEAEHFSKMVQNLQDIKNEMQENNSYLKELCGRIKEMKVLKEKELNELISHNYAMEKSAQTKNELKLQFLRDEAFKTWNSTAIKSIVL